MTKYGKHSDMGQLDVWQGQTRAVQPSGPDYGHALFLAELDLFIDPSKPWLIPHHVEAALSLLRLTREILSNPVFVESEVDLRGVIRDIRAIPAVQQERLHPVFEQRSLWADGEDHQRRFNQWKSDFTSKLDLIGANEADGHDKLQSLYRGYVWIMEVNSKPLISLYHDMLDALRGTFRE